MKILSHFFDHRIQAVNVFVEIRMSEYMEIAEDIIHENEFQRKKVINSQISGLLREDILIGCSIPPLVLAVHRGIIPGEFDYNVFGDADLKLIDQAFTEKKLLILDGKQRTHVFLKLYKDLQENSKKEEVDQAINEQNLKTFLDNTLRIEVYVGINKLNILYRMLTLNSGQTSMSTRHLMEMLYLDYLDIEFHNLRLIPDKADEPVAKSPHEFVFKDVLDGFTSYLDKDENTLERSEILDNIKSAKSIKKVDGNKDLFEKFVITFKLLIDKLIILSNGYTITEEDLQLPEYAVKGQPFGKTAIEIFKRSQSISGFGAAISVIIEARNGYSLEKIQELINEISFQEENYRTSALLIIKYFSNIRDKSKKIGIDQRFYFRALYKYLFDPESSYHLKLDKAVEYAYKKIREEKYYLQDLSE